MNSQPAAGVRFRLAISPLTLCFHRLVERHIAADGQLDRPGQHVGYASIGVADEFDLDLVDLRSSQDIAIVGLESQVVALDELLYSVGAGAHEARSPVGPIAVAGPILLI